MLLDVSLSPGSHPASRGHLPDGLLPRLLLELHRALLRFVLGGRGERRAVLARPRRLVLHGVDGLQLVLIFLDLGRSDDPRAPDAPELGAEMTAARGQRAAALARLAAEEALVDGVCGPGLGLARSSPSVPRNRGWGRAGPLRTGRGRAGSPASPKTSGGGSRGMRVRRAKRDEAALRGPGSPVGGNCGRDEGRRRARELPTGAEASLVYSERCRRSTLLALNVSSPSRRSAISRNQKAVLDAAAGRVGPRRRTASGSLP